jgi:chitodextrinase
VGLTEENNVYDPWHIVKEGKEFYTHTFSDLKPGISYAFFVKAYDGDELICQYPIFNGCMTAKTAETDKEAPTVTSKAIRVTNITRDSISIQWEGATDNMTAKDKIRYQIWFKLSNTPSDPWHQVYEGTGITSYTFKGLKEGTMYSFYIKAFDEAGNSIQYPLANGCMTARTAALDKEAPHADSRDLTVINVTPERFTIAWKAAKDNVTAASQIRYQVFLYEKGSWWLKKDAPGITSYTFTGLTPDTQYFVFVRAMDAVGNTLKYPDDTAGKAVKTKPARVNKLDLTIKQGATVLRGTDTICLELTYNYVKIDADGNIIGRQGGSWKHKWSNTKTVTTVIALPAGWYFENNQVHIYIDSRRAASAGLNKWKKCSEGDVDITGGVLKLALSGSYYYHSVRYTQL